MFPGARAKPPTVGPGDTPKTMFIEFEFDHQWTFAPSDKLTVRIGEKEANELVAQLLAQLARIQK
jgi:hypothetical protein